MVSEIIKTLNKNIVRESILWYSIYEATQQGGLLTSSVNNTWRKFRILQNLMIRRKSLWQITNWLLSIWQCYL